jgi:dGTPase
MIDDAGPGLAPYAVSEANSRGRRHAEPAPRRRTQFQRDRDRVIHCSAFRRLEYKTQVFVNHEGDMFRTRLTHTLEVAQIARTIARALRLNEDLTEAIALAHDLGHTPFGHAGQHALNECMRDFGGFEHNLHSIRVVDELEMRYPAFPGLNLLFETREGMLKHCNRAKAEALGELGRRFVEGRQASLEAQIANVADEIAYNHHDMDDGLRAQLLTPEQLRALPFVRDTTEDVMRRWPESDAKRLRYTVIREMLNRFVLDLIDATTERLAQLAPRDIEDIRAHSSALVDFSPEIRAHHLELKRLLFAKLYKHERVYDMAQRSQAVVRDLFYAFMREPGLIPGPACAGKTDEAATAQRVADYIAGMTDRFAIAEHQRLGAAGR